ILFGPSPAGAAYLPALADLVIRVDKSSCADLGSPRMAEMVIGEEVDHDAKGCTRVRFSVSGHGDVLAANEDAAIESAKRYLAYMPDNWRERPAEAERAAPASATPVSEIVPKDQNTPFDMYRLIDALVDGGSFFEIKKEFAPELITG